MSYFTDVQAATAKVADLEGQLAAARAALAKLQALSPGFAIDVSEHQGDVDWLKVKGAGVGVAFVRCSDGDYRDKFYSAGRVTSVRTQGIVLGAYHYARVASDANGQRSPVTEAAMAYYFASSAGWGRPGDLPMGYDVEKDPGETTTFQGQSPTKAVTHVAGFIDAYQRLAGHYPVFYSNPDTLALLLPVATSAQIATLAKCPLWIAHVGVSKPTVPSQLPPWTFWQYDFKGSVTGVTGDVDLDRIAISRDDLQALLIK